MNVTHQILADISAGISELKKNPMAVIGQGHGNPVAILNRNEPVSELQFEIYVVQRVFNSFYSGRHS